jgi:hypothetical protein
LSQWHGASEWVFRRAQLAAARAIELTAMSRDAFRALVIWAMLVLLGLSLFEIVIRPLLSVTS